MNAFTWIFVAALAAATLTRWWLAQRQVRHVRAHRDAVPPMFAATIPAEAHQKAADYSVAKAQLDMVEIFVSAFVLLILTLGGLINWLSTTWERVFEPQSLSHGVALCASVAVLLGALDLPLSVYRTFVLETRFGFNRMTPKLFAIDLLKQTMLAAAFGIPLTTDTTTNFYLGALSASWELDIWGRIRRSDEAARANLLATEDARRGVWLSLVSDVVQAYFELLALDVQVQIARDSAVAFQGTYNLFQDRLRFGLASHLQTARAEGALGGALANIPELEKQTIAKENQIAILLGRAPAPIPRGKPMYAQLVVPEVPVGLPSTLLERRPDLRQAEQQLVRANAQVGVAKAEFFPKLSLTGILGTASPEISALTSGGSLVWAVAAGLTGPIFQGGRILQNYRASLAEREHAVLHYQQAVITALREVADSLTALAKLRDAEVGQQRSVTGLQEAVALATERYGFGLASYYEVLEAQQQLFPAQHLLAQIRRDRLAAYVQLYKALGGGWSLTNAQWTDQSQAAGGGETHVQPGYRP
jgi:multidrug efflux system outer membrane protein